MVKKPDKFYALAETLPVGFSRGDVAWLLYHYHQEVVELVKGERLPASCCHNSDFMDGNHDAIKTIIEKLKEMAK